MSDDEAHLQQLKTIVGQVLPADQADSFVKYARLDAFRGEDGEIDQDKVRGHLTAIVVAGQPQSVSNWGQSSGNPPPRNAGDTAREALKRRHGVSHDGGPSASSHISSGGATARAALARRHGIQ